MLTYLPTLLVAARNAQGQVSEGLVGQLVSGGAACTQGDALAGGSGSDDEGEAAVLCRSLGIGSRQVAMVVGDPFYLESHLGAFAGGGGTQWNNLAFWKHLDTLRPLLSSSPPAVILPSGASIFAMGVEFASLRNPQEPVGLVEVGTCGSCGGCIVRDPCTLCPSIKYA